MPEYFLHGVEVVEVDDGIRPIRAVKSSIVGLVGTAPNARTGTRAAAAFGSDKAALSLTAKTAGISGNAIRLAIRDPAPDAPLSVDVAGRVITVTPAIESKAIATTAAQLLEALKSNSAVAALVEVAHAKSSDGTAKVTSQTVTLAGGKNNNSAKIEFGSGKAALALTARQTGEAGNGIQLVIKDPLADADIKIVVENRAITVTLAIASKAISTTGKLLLEAINRNSAAAALVEVAHAQGSDGTGIVKPGEVRLTGGTDDAFPVNTPVLVAGPRAAALLGDGGTLKAAYEAVYAQGAREAVVIRVAEGNSAAATLAAVAGQATEGSGVFALLASCSKLDLTPRILAAPGFTKTGTSQVAPVVTNLIGVAEKLRAVVVADGPDTNETDAKLARRNYGADRLFIVDPAVTVFDPATATHATRPASAYVAGLIARRDVERGFWWSPSNQVIRGIAGTSRPVAFHLSEPQTEANRMNEAEVATIVRRSGFRLWGNRSTGADAQWAFLSVRRTADILYESIERAHLWAMDRPFSPQLILDIRDGVSAFGQRLVSQGALLGFRCWVDPELNTKETLKAGKLYLNFDFEPPAPLEHLVFRAHREGAYYDELISSVGVAA